jgi:hypothetical protein
LMPLPLFASPYTSSASTYDFRCLPHIRRPYYHYVILRCWYYADILLRHILHYYLCHEGHYYVTYTEGLLMPGQEVIIRHAAATRFITLRHACCWPAPLR